MDISSQLNQLKNQKTFSPNFEVFTYNLNQVTSEEDLRQEVENDSTLSDTQKKLILIPNRVGSFIYRLIVDVLRDQYESSEKLHTEASRNDKAFHKNIWKGFKSQTGKDFREAEKKDIDTLLSYIDSLQEHTAKNITQDNFNANCR